MYIIRLLIIFKFLINYSTTRTCKFLILYLQIIIVSLLDFVLLAWTGLILTHNYLESSELIDKNFYLILVVIRIIFSWYSHKVYLDAIFKLRENITVKYLKNILLNTSEINNNKLKTNIVINSYLNEFIYSLCIPLTTLISEGIFIIIIASYLIFKIGIISFYLIPISIILTLPLIIIVSKSKTAGYQKSIIENEMFSNISVFAESNIEIIKLGLLNYITNIINVDVSKWLFNMKNHYFYSMLPKNYIENLIFVIASGILFYYNLSNENLSINYDSIALMIFPLLRSFPSVGRITSAIQQIKYGIPHCNNLIDELRFVNLKDNADNNKIMRETDKNSKLLLNANGYYFVNENKIKVNNFIIYENTINKINGLSGSGKSTFLKYMSGIYLSKNLNIILNHVGEFDSIMYMPDKCLIISGDLIKNLNLGNNELIDDQSIQKVLNIVGVREDFLNSKVISFNGGNISTGQRQRIGLARALLKKPKILILDEAISNLPMNERETIVKNILEMGITVILTDHTEDYNITMKNWQIDNNEIYLYEK